MFNFLKKFKKEKELTCEQCKQVKKESDGNFVLGGSAFCCKECCDDPKDKNNGEKKDTTCEFC